MFFVVWSTRVNNHISDSSYFAHSPRCDLLQELTSDVDADRKIIGQKSWNLKVIFLPNSLVDFQVIL